METLNPIQISESSKALVEIFDTWDEIAQATSKDLQNGRVALSGGSTYSTLFEYWTKLNIDIRNGSFWPADERKVPWDHPGCNWRMTYDKFLNPLGMAKDKKHWPKNGDEFEKMLEIEFNSSEFIFDTIFLGVGDDGHTASLFPGGEYLDDTHSQVLETISPKPPFPRITLSPKTIGNAKKVITIVSGANKREITSRIMDIDEGLPIVKLLQRCRHSIIYINRNAL